LVFADNPIAEVVIDVGHAMHGGFSSSASAAVAGIRSDPTATAVAALSIARLDI
jgi:hypothetical protein